MLSDHHQKTTFDNIVRYFCMFRNALVLILSTIAVYFWSDKVNISERFKLSGEIPQGLPQFKVPEFYLSYGNETEIQISFFQIIHNFDYNVIFLAFAAVFMNIAIAKSYCKSQKF